LPEIGMEFRRRAKMLYLQEQALRKAIAGTTAINEVLRVLSSGKKQGAPAPQ
jgi:type II secretory ATPase GspE/PulE/Tfp pilus assembly ATPase PilB-like protein